MIVNLDKRQYLHPHRFGDGLKLMEFGCSSSGTLCGLAILLADGNGRGGGDLRADDSIIGSWAGDRIVVAGDYADGRKWLEDVAEEELQAIADVCYRRPDKVNLYHYAHAKFTDVSDLVIQAMLKDKALRSNFKEVAESHRNCWAAEDGPLASSLKALLSA